MAKLTIGISSFKTGDIIRTGHVHRHMTLFVAGPEAVKFKGSKAGFVHASDKVMFETTDRYNQPDTNISAPYEYYSCPDATLGKKAADIASCWVETKYGSGPDQKLLGPKVAQVSRFGGMVSTSSRDHIPYNINALIRTLKWVYRAEKGLLLSANRGTTCAAFVAACYQTAAMSLYLEEKELLWNIKKGYELISKIVESKDAAHTRRMQLPPIVATSPTSGNKVSAQNKPTDPHLYKGYASRDHSNRILTDDSWAGTVNEQWKKFYKEFFLLTNSYEGDEPKDIDQIISAPFFFDIKYINAPLLSDILGQKWTHSPYTEF